MDETLVEMSRPRTLAAPLALGLAMGLSACTPPPEGQAFRLPFQPRYQAARSATPVLLSSTEWWRDLDDPTLDALVEIALAQNLSLATARAQAEAARNAAATVPGAASISGEIEASLLDTDRSDLNSASSADLGFDWLFDPWGERASQERAAAARAEAAQAELDAARLLMLLELSNAYLDLRYRQVLLEILNTEYRARLDTVRLTRSLEVADEATQLEITRARSRAASVKADLPEARAAVRAAQVRIAVLAGTSPGALPADLARRLESPGNQPGPRMSPEIGIPADLLRNRPDLKVAEAVYNAAVAETGVARAALYPRLSLGGSITLSAANSATSERYFLGPVLRLPSLPAGPSRARVAQRDAEAQAAYSSWQETALEAVGEVEDALVSYHATTEAAGAAEEAVSLARQTQTLTRNVYEQGEALLGDLVDAEDEIAQAARRRARLRYDHARAYVSLHVNLGAGHATEAAPPG